MKEKKKETTRKKIDLLKEKYELYEKGEIKADQFKDYITNVSSYL